MNLDIKFIYEGGNRSFLRRKYRNEAQARSTCAWIVRHLVPSFEKYSDLDAIVRVVMELKSLNFKPVLMNRPDPDSLTLSICVSYDGYLGLTVGTAAERVLPFTPINHNTDFSKLARLISTEIC